MKHHGALTPPAARAAWVLEGRRPSRLAVLRVARAGSAFVPETGRIFADLTVWRNLDVASRAASATTSAPWTIERVFDLFPKLGGAHEPNAGSSPAASSRC